MQLIVSNYPFFVLNQKSTVSKQIQKLVLWFRNGRTYLQNEVLCLKFQTKWVQVTKDLGAEVHQFLQGLDQLRAVVLQIVHVWPWKKGQQQFFPVFASSGKNVDFSQFMAKSDMEKAAEAFVPLKPRDTGLALQVHGSAPSPSDDTDLCVVLRPKWVSLARCRTGGPGSQPRSPWMCTHPWRSGTLPPTETEQMLCFGNSFPGITESSTTRILPLAQCVLSRCSLPVYFSAHLEKRAESLLTGFSKALKTGFKKGVTSFPSTSPILLETPPATQRDSL